MQLPWKSAYIILHSYFTKKGFKTFKFLSLFIFFHELILEKLTLEIKQAYSILSNPIALHVLVRT